MTSGLTRKAERNSDVLPLSASRVWREHKAKLVLLGVVLLALGMTFVQPYINQYILLIIVYVGINITLSVSLGLINGFTGQFSLGHAGFMAIGAYTTTQCAVLFNLAPGTVSGTIGFLAALVIGGSVAAVFGLLVGVPSLRLKGDYLAIVTLGFGEIIRVIIQNLDFLGGARGFTEIPKLSNMFWVFGIAALTVFVVWNLVRSTYGKGFLAVADDEISAEAMGINSTRYKVIAFVTGAFFAGIAGGLYAHFVVYINPSQFGFVKSIEIVIMVMVGGVHSIIGVILSATLLTVLREVLRTAAGYREVIYSLALILIMIWRPQGLFGGSGIWLKSLWRRLHPPKPRAVEE